MTEYQNIVFENNLDFKILEGGIIKKHTKILNLFLVDLCSANCLQLIGNKFEWVPKIWINFEKERLHRIEELNIISFMGDFSQFVNYCQNLFPKTKVNYYLANLHQQKDSIDRTLKNQKKLDNNNQKQIPLYASIGTMRLNRYILVKESNKNGYNNIFYPEITYNESKKFEYQISQVLNKDMDTPKQFNKKRLFKEELTPEKFNSKQIYFLQKAYINFVCTNPNTDWWVNLEDEKYFDCILTKSLPFMLCEKNSNLNGVKLLGFLPYKGFNLSNDNNDNSVLRWQSLLEDNQFIFKNEEKVKELYHNNYDIIEENFQRLINTDWEKEKTIQFNKLPKFVIDFMNSRSWTWVWPK